MSCTRWFTRRWDSFAKFSGSGLIISYIRKMCWFIGKVSRYMCKSLRFSEGALFDSKPNVEKLQKEWKLVSFRGFLALVKKGLAEGRFASLGVEKLSNFILCGVPINCQRRNSSNFGWRKTFHFTSSFTPSCQGKFYLKKWRVPLIKKVLLLTSQVAR